MTVSRPEDEFFDPASAARVLGGEGERVRAAFDVRVADQFAAWGVAWLVGLGLVWFQVRDQIPYRGPSTAVIVVLAVLMAAALVVTVDRVHRATVGMHGGTARRGRSYGVAWGCGVVAGLLMVVGAARSGAPPTVVGTLVVSSQLLIAGVLYACGAAVFGGRTKLGLGCWLILLAVVAAFCDPVVAAALGALGGGGGFLAAAAVSVRSSRRTR